MGVISLLFTLSFLLSIGLNNGFTLDNSSQNCGSNINITATTSLTLGRNVTHHDENVDNGYCNVTFESTDSISLQIVDYLYLTPISYVYVENKQSNKCIQKFLSFSGNITSCDELLGGKTLTLHIRNALLKVSVTLSYSNSSKCTLDCHKISTVCSNDENNCLMSKYDSIYKTKSRQMYFLPSCEPFTPLTRVIYCEPTSFQYYAFSCPGNCVCMLGQSTWTQKCNGKTSTSLIIYNPYVKGFSFSKTGIQNISNNAFNNLIDLRSLRLDQNYIQKLPSDVFGSSLIDLETLSLAGNLIEELPYNLFHSLYNLTHLDLGINLITDIPVETFKNLQLLRTMNLSSNCIVSLPIKAFIPLFWLEWLDLSNNKLTELPGKVFEYTALERLYLDNNQLEHLPYDSFHELIFHLELLLLDLSYNRLKSFPEGLFNSLKDLWFLKIHNNELSYIPENSFSNCTELIKLHLNNNKLTVLSNKTFQLPKLIILDIGYNQLAWLPNGIFNSLVFLGQLNIENNHLTALQNNVFESVTSLTLLRLNDNFISKLLIGTFDSIPNLRFLFLGDNDLIELSSDVFSNFWDLVVLDISGNKLSRIDRSTFKNLVSLDYLNLARNTISFLPNLENLNKLSILDISINSLQNLSQSTFKGLHNLEFLNLSYNNFADLPQITFQELVSLISLDLSHNNLSRIYEETFHNQSNLVRLSIAGNSLKYLHIKSFFELKKLSHLDLQENRITILHAKVFLSLINLQFLNLSANSVQTIPSNIFNIVSERFQSVDLRDNELLLVTHDSFEGLSNSVNILVDNFATCCFMENKSCVSTFSRPVYLTCKRMLDKFLLRILMWVLGMSAVVFNLLVFCFRCAEKDGGKVQKFLISNLSLSDLIMGVSMVLLAGADAYFGVYFPSYASSWRSGSLCKLAGILSILSSEASVFFITLISFDRFLAVKYTFSSRRLGPTSVKVCVGILWFVSGILSVIPTLLSSVYPHVYEVSEVCVGIPLVKRPLQTLFNSSVQVDTTDFEFDYQFASVFGLEDFLLNMTLTKTKQTDIVSFLRSAISGYQIATYFSIVTFIVLNLICFLSVAYCYFSIFAIARSSAKAASRNQDIQNELKIGDENVSSSIDRFFLLGASNLFVYSCTIWRDCSLGRIVCLDCGIHFTYQFNYKSISLYSGFTNF